jgi:hypothetical protein
MIDDKVKKIDENGMIIGDTKYSFKALKNIGEYSG